MNKYIKRYCQDPAYIDFRILAMYVLSMTLVASPGSLAATTTQSAVMSIEVYNPTTWEGPGLVEIPTGSIAAPGLVDWNKVLLLSDGKEIPWSIREGGPHWKTRAKPVKEPRAEDLLVFSIAVPPGKTAHVELISGKPSTSSAIARQDGHLVITYPDIGVSIDEKTGMLIDIRAFDESVLKSALEVAFFKLPGEGLELAGDQSLFRPVSVPGETDPMYIAAKDKMGMPSSRLLFYRSSGAMTEVHFVLTSGDGLDMLLTYRIHKCGLVEIESDERPWTGRSPWISHAVDYVLPFSGNKAPLPHILNPAPYYGFRDYSKLVRYADRVYLNPRSAVLELGEQTINGRRWNRRLYVAHRDKAKRIGEWAKFADEGFVVRVTPQSALFTVKPIRISCDETSRAAAEMMVRAIDKLVGRAEIAPQNGQSADIRLQIAKHSSVIEEDGFAVYPDEANQGITVSALTQFGLTYAASKIAQNLRVESRCILLPLIAANPAVKLRAVGPGGGDFEVDFPYETDADWEHAFDGVISSGMNVIVDLSMWGNWKMPVSYKYMPELKSESADAFDELTGAKFSEIDMHREHGLKLLNYLHDRGVMVWQWIPIGCVPTTYAKAHPDAMAPGSDKIPCFTHQLYTKYIEAFVKELLETYPLDGIVMVRDDNGGLCSCDRCKQYVADSHTKDAAWEQYLIIYKILRSHGFRGDIAIYPYFDIYQPRMDPLLPEDLLVVGHGSGPAVLVRNYERIGPMGDTWIDNLFAGFRLAPITRMKRLLSDRGSFWLGGAYCGTELPWESIGWFGCEPTSTVNTFRYAWGSREFGPSNAAAYTHLNAIIDGMWDINQCYLLPKNWIELSDQDRVRIATECRTLISDFRASLATLKSAVDADHHAAWFAHLALFGTYLDYHLQRLEVIIEMNKIISANKGLLTGAGTLPNDTRDQLIAKHRKVYSLAGNYDKEAAAVPGNMMSRVRSHAMTQPYKEWQSGYDHSLDFVLAVKQFTGTMTVAPCEMRAGQEFVIKVELRNTGLCPWLPEAGFTLRSSGDNDRFGLSKSVALEGEPLVFGDSRVIELRGVAPSEPGEVDLSLEFHSSNRFGDLIAATKTKLKWE